MAEAEEASTAPAAAAAAAPSEFTQQQIEAPPHQEEAAAAAAAAAAPVAGVEAEETHHSGSSRDEGEDEDDAMAVAVAPAACPAPAPAPPQAPALASAPVEVASAQLLPADARLPTQEPAQGRQQQGQAAVDVEALTEAVLTVYAQQAQRIEEAYRTALASNTAAFEQALRTIISALGSYPAAATAAAAASSSALGDGQGDGTPLVMVPVPVSVLKGGGSLFPYPGSQPLQHHPQPTYHGYDDGRAGGGGGGGGSKRKHRAGSGWPEAAEEEDENEEDEPSDAVRGRRPRKQQQQQHRRPRPVRDHLPVPLQAFLRGFERYMTRHHISAYKRQRLAPGTVQVRVGQAQRLLAKRGLGATRFPTLEELQGLEAEMRGDKSYSNTAVDLVSYVQWREGPGAGVKEEVGEGEGEGDYMEEDEELEDYGGEEDEGGSEMEEDEEGGGGSGRKRGRVGWRRSAVSPGGSAKGVGTGSPKSPIARAARAFVNWMKKEDTGVRVSHSTAYSYLVIITNLLVAAQCELTAIQTPADLRAYVLSHRVALEACLPPKTQVPYPKARGAFKKLWEWAAGERIWEDEGNYWACRPSSRQYRAFMGEEGAAGSGGGGGRDGASLSLSAGLEEGEEEEEEDGDDLATETEESELEIDDAEMEELEESAAAMEEEGAAGTEGSVRSKPEAKEGEEKATPVHVLLLAAPNGGVGDGHERAAL